MLSDSEKHDGDYKYFFKIFFSVSLWMRNNLTNKRVRGQKRSAIQWGKSGEQREDKTSI
jgi:hypothetical protein